MTAAWHTHPAYLAGFAAGILAADPLRHWADGYFLGTVRGEHDGFAAGHAAANDDLAAALTRALGGPDADDYHHAVRRHHTAVDSKRRRDEWDAEVRRDVERVSRGEPPHRAETWTIQAQREAWWWARTGNTTRRWRWPGAGRKAAA
jgi:hypothetical protein